MIPAFERFVVGIAIMPLDDFPKLASIDRFEEFPKNAIHISHARPLSESRQPESIRFTLDLPGMRCGIVNRSRDRPASGEAGLADAGIAFQRRRSAGSGWPRTSGRDRRRLVFGKNFGSLEGRPHPQGRREPALYAGLCVWPVIHRFEQETAIFGIIGRSAVSRRRSDRGYRQGSASRLRS